MEQTLRVGLPLGGLMELCGYLLVEGAAAGAAAGAGVLVLSVAAGFDDSAEGAELDSPPADGLAEA